MNGYKVTYPSGATEVVTTDEHENVEAFAASKFGDFDLAEHGVKVKKLSDKEVDKHVRGLQDEAQVVADEATPAEALDQMSQEMLAAAAEAPATEKKALEAQALQTQADAEALAAQEKSDLTK